MIEITPKNRNFIIFDIVLQSAFIIGLICIQIFLYISIYKYPKSHPEIGYIAYIFVLVFILISLFLLFGIFLFATSINKNLSLLFLKISFIEDQLIFDFRKRQISISKKSILKCLSNPKGILLIIRNDCKEGFITHFLSSDNYNNNEMDEIKKYFSNTLVSDKNEKLSIVEKLGLDSFRTNHLYLRLKTLPEHINISDNIPENLIKPRSFTSRYIWVTIFWLIHLIYACKIAKEKGVFIAILFALTMTFVFILILSSFKRIQQASKNHHSP